MKAEHVPDAVFMLVSRVDTLAAGRFRMEFQLEEECDIRRAMVLVNRYWRDYLARLPSDTMHARSFLLDDAPFNEWLSLFERGILPELDRHVCPRALLAS